jgi:hypothetical protein
MSGCDTFTVPQRVQAAGRIYPSERWPTGGAVSITRRMTAGRTKVRNGSAADIAKANPNVCFGLKQTNRY